jgi:peptidoglycan/xylan/chitin deacetylase (PgdA/CDA1 family)/GT2 family glycosyltransferase
MPITVVIPTYQRRDLVVAAVRGLAQQDFDGDFDVVVVVDGSTDGTARALRELAMPFPLTVLEQSNQGAAAARTAGGVAARGEILLFIDDDMEADPRLLTEHDRSHGESAGIVLGDIRLHPESPRGLLSRWVHEWVDGRTRRLSAPGASVRVADLIGGQISVSRAAFRDVGGFDARLTHGGSFGNEDIDFGYRLLRRGHRAVFNPKAVTWQRYTIRPRQFLRQWRQAGHASVPFARKHPELAAQIFDLSVNRRRYRGLARVPALAAPLRWLAVRLVERGHEGPWAERLFFSAQAVEYCRGLREAGGMPRPRALRVLAYHAIEETGDAGRLEPYGVRPADFRHHVAALVRAGYEFVSADEVLHFLRGAGGLPPRPVLLTFDDCYASLLRHAVPVLEERRIPAVAFAVTGRLGSTNEWDTPLGLPQLRLLDVDGLRRLAEAGVEIGAHSRTHAQLPRVGAAELTGEVAGSRDELRTLGLGAARLFAYPYGESDERVRQAVERAAYQAAFTVEPGFVRRGVDPYRIPRIEILRRDVGWRFRWKVRVAGPLRKPDERPIALARGAWTRWGAPAVRALRRWYAGPGTVAGRIAPWARS